MAKEMRDLNRIREDSEFRLNGSEFKLAVAGVSAICLLVFVVGFFVGRHFPSGLFEREAPAEALEQRAAVVETPAGDPEVVVKEFTFYEELRKSSQEPDPVVPAAPEAAAAPTGAPTDVPVAADPAPVAEKTTAKIQAPDRKPEPVSDPADVAAKAASPSTKYTVQVSAFEEAQAAENLSSHLREKGYRAYTMAKRLRGRGTWYRVRVGQFDKRGEAEEMAALLEKKENLSTFITPYTR